MTLIAPAINRVRFRSPHFNARPGGIDAIILHTSAGAWPGDAAWLCNPASKVSYHYLIAPSGTIYELVDPQHRAWHAGASSLAGRGDCNDYSIGVSISHRDANPALAAQYYACGRLLDYLMATYHVTPSRVASHRLVATPRGRKTDPTDALLNTEIEIASFVAAVLGARP